MGSLTQLVGYLGWLVGCYYALLLVLKLSKSPWAKYFPGLRSSTEKSDLELEQARTVKERLQDHIQHDRHQGRPAGYARLFGTFLSIIIVSWTLMGILAVQNHEKIKSLELQLEKYNSANVTEHHVAIIRQLENGDFAYISDEEPGGGTFRPCPSDIANKIDVAGILSQGIGFVADRAAWEERGTCKSILRADLGFWWKDQGTNFKYARAN